MVLGETWSLEEVSYAKIHQASIIMFNLSRILVAVCNVALRDRAPDYLITVWKDRVKLGVVPPVWPAMVPARVIFTLLMLLS